MKITHMWKSNQERKYRRETLEDALTEYWKRKAEYLDELDREKKIELSKTATMEAVAPKYGVVPATLRAFKNSMAAIEINKKYGGKRYG